MTCRCACFFFQAEDGIRDLTVTGVQTCALPILELVLIDVQVSARNGQPIENLRPDQFEVNIDGKRLPIATLDFVRYNATEQIGRASCREREEVRGAGES